MHDCIVRAPSVRVFALQICEYNQFWPDWFWGSSPRWIASVAREVIRAGGAGMILGLMPVDMPNPIDSWQEAFVGLPYVYVLPTERLAALDYALDAAQPTAAFTAAEFCYDDAAPRMAPFSTRGPATFVNQVVLKPDITAPGQYKLLCVT